jgi:uncharacterized OsmC-like protein
MNVVNRINLDRLKDTIQKIEEDPSKAKKITRIEGEWVLDNVDVPSFRAEIQKFTIEADQPIILGGGGTQPSPMHYCLYGIAVCVAATFATVAAMERIELKKMRVAVEDNINFPKVLGIADKPIIEEVKLKITVASDSGEEKIRQLMRMAEDRCPAVFCLTNPVKVTVEVAKGGSGE